jgi:methylenetetrahydrofolate reductase (NADPH)
MINVVQPDRDTHALDDLKGRIVSFMQGASTEITPSEEHRLSALAAVLPAGTPVYVAHTPNASFDQVIRAALAVRRAGLLATPHIAVRRVANAAVLRTALSELRDEGVLDILLIAGDAPRPIGEFSDTLDVLESGIVEDSGITRIGIAGHPEGHNAVAADTLWQALADKQRIAARSGLNLHIVTQFGLDGGAFKRWQHELLRRGIHLPVRVGIAGPAPIARLLHFAIQCGIGASARALIRQPGAATGFFSAAAVRPDQHLLGLLASQVPAQIIAPHFFAFGGAIETARWMQAIAAGAFSIDADGARFRIRT